MTKRLSVGIGIAMLLVFGLCCQSVPAKTNKSELVDKKYSWKSFSFTYPQGWKVVVDENFTANTRQVKLENSRFPEMAIMFSLVEEAVRGGQDESAPNSLEVSSAYGLGIALRLAGNEGEKAVAVSHGSLGVGEYREISTRFHVTTGESTFTSIEAFSGENEGNRVMGMISVNRHKGKLEQSDALLGVLNEIYDIVASLAY